MYNIDRSDPYCMMFLEESKEHLDQMEQNFIDLENGQADPEIINTIFRSAHSLKSASATMSIKDMSELAHNLESLLNQVKEGHITISRTVMDIIFKSIDVLKTIHSALCREENPVCDVNPVIKAIESIILESNVCGCVNVPQFSQAQDFYSMEKKLISTLNVTENVYRIHVELNEDTEMKAIKEFMLINALEKDGKILLRFPDKFETLEDEPFGNHIYFLYQSEENLDKIKKSINSISEIKAFNICRPDTPQSEKDSSSASKSSKSHAEGEITTIRVDVNRINKLINLAGEFVIARETLVKTGMELRAKYSQDALTSRLIDAMEKFSFIGSELQETLLSTRMLPIGHIFNKFPRIIRDIAAKCGKEIDLTMDGKETEIDRGIIEDLLDPLTHLIRNSVDHGIESSEERIALGKSPRGSISLSARHEESYIIIEVSDDGRGIDPSRIKKKILEKGLMSEEALSDLTENEIIQFIFEPNFSTAESVTEISGRGFGMDVVKSNINKLSGIISIKSIIGQGTKISIRLPLTLAIIRALLVKQYNCTFAIPVSFIIEAMRLKGSEVPEHIHKSGKAEVFLWQGAGIPIVRLDQYFHLKENSDNEKLFVIVLGYAEKRLALIVEELIEELEIVIKPIGDYIGEGQLFGKMKGISGVSILGDGSFAHVLDVASISTEYIKYR